MAVQEIIQEVKTLSSRQVLVFILLASLACNYKQIELATIAEKNHKNELNQERKLTESEKEKYRTILKEFILSNEKNTKESYENRRKLDSITIEMKFKK